MWLWWLGNAVLLLVIVPTVLLLANRVMRPALEIKRYAADIDVNGAALAGHLEPVPAVADTRDLVSAAKGLAVRYLTAAGPLL